MSSLCVRVWRSWGLATGLLVGLWPEAQAQAIRVRTATVRPKSVNILSGITLSTTPGGVNFTLIPKSQAIATAPIAITSSVGLPLLTVLQIYGFFSLSTSALTGSVSGALIPTSCISGQASGAGAVATTYTTFTQTDPFGGASAGMLLVQVGGIVFAQTQTNNLTLKIDLSTLPQLPADTYVGTLYLQAQIY